MSRPSSTPAVEAANSAPWMNVNGRKNERNESVGKPGSRVAAFSPFEFTAISISGNVRMITFEGCRSVRRTERHATTAIW